MLNVRGHIRPLGLAVNVLAGWVVVSWAPLSVADRGGFLNVSLRLSNLKIFECLCRNESQPAAALFDEINPEQAEWLKRRVFQFLLCLGFKLVEFQAHSLNCPLCDVFGHWFSALVNKPSD